MSHRSKNQSQASTAADLYGAEDDFSEASETDKFDRHHHASSYYTTNLIVDKNLTLAHVNIEKLTQSMIADIRTWCTAKCRDKRCFFGLVDPKSRLSIEKRSGDVETLVPFD